MKPVRRSPSYPGVLLVVILSAAGSAIGCSKQQTDKPDKRAEARRSGKVPTCDKKDDFLTKEEKTTLLKLARRSAEAAVKSGGKLDHDRLVKGLTLTDTLKKNMGAFVTLHKHGKLRGCIGYLQPIEPLYKSVISNARSAALRDRRFQPVQSAELNLIDVEVSVLSLPVPVSGPDDIQIGCHGIIMEKGGRRATFLPHVAPQFKWNRDQTLTRLSVKGWGRPVRTRI